MIISGLLLYGAAQKNRVIGWAFFLVLFAYLLTGSRSVAFFAVNIAVVLLLSAALKRINCQALSGASILIYSVIIDVICFYFFPLFPPSGSLGAYVLAGLIFNLRSAIPAIIVGIAMSVLAVVRHTIESRRKSRALPGKLLTLKPVG